MHKVRLMTTYCLSFQVDIDDILKRAETHHTQDTSNEADELLSQFKVVSIDNLEDEELERYDPGEWKIPCIINEVLGVPS